MSVIETISLDHLILDERLQSRDGGLDQATVQDYREAYESGVEVPPGDVFRNSKGRSLLADGFHRVEGARLAGRTELPFRVYPGEFLDAKLYSAGCNHAHGLRRTEADKVRQVGMCLEVQPDWSDQAVAEHCHVGRKLVANVRAARAAGAALEEPAQKKPGPAPARKKPGPAKVKDRQAEAIAKLLKDHPDWSNETILAQVDGAKLELVQYVRRDLEEKEKIPKKPVRTTKADELKDQEGKPVPDRLRDHFGDKYLEKTATELEALGRRARGLLASVKSNATLWAPWLRASEILSRLETISKEAELAVAQLRAAQPYAVCPTCGGKRCAPRDHENPPCRNTGWMPRWRFEELKAVPQE